SHCIDFTSSLFLFTALPTSLFYTLSLHDALPISLAGEILHEPHGDKGFGYDPLFKTLKGIYLGEITSEEKGEISHRGKALEKLRSEEHTSELQSRFDLVCRLLLEKKKQKYNTNT